MMVVVYGAMMLLGLIGMIVCSKKQRTNPAMQPVAFVLFIVVVIGAIMLMTEMGVFGNSNSSLLSNERAFYSSQGYKVGKFLAAENGGKKVLVLAEPGFEQNENIKLLVDQFKDGYGSDNVTVTTLDIKNNNPEEGMPLYMMMKAKDFDQVFEANPDAGIVVNLLGLPEDARRMKYWSMDKAKRPLFFMIGDFSGMVRGLPNLIEKGDLAGIVIANPSAKYDVKAPGNMEEAFNIRYVLVSKDNVKEYKDKMQ